MLRKWRSLRDICKASAGVTNQPTRLPWVDNLEFAGKPKRPSTSSCQIRTTKEGVTERPMGSHCVRLPPVWVHSQASRSQPEATVGQWGQQLERQAGHRAEESEDQLGLIRPLHIWPHRLWALRPPHSNSPWLISASQLLRNFLSWPFLI